MFLSKDYYRFVVSSVGSRSLFIIHYNFIIKHQSHNTRQNVSTPMYKSHTSYS